MAKKSDVLFTPETSALVLIDYQPEMLSQVQTMDTRILEINVRAVARMARQMGVPTILTTVGVQSGVNRPTIPSLKGEIAEAHEFDRSSMDAWEDETVRKAIEQTGRKKLVFCALWTEVCLAFPVLRAQEAGYQTAFVADAVGGTSEVAHRMAIERMVHARSVPTGWVALLCEWVRDWKGPYAHVARDIFRWHHQEMHGLSESTSEEPSQSQHLM